LQGVTGGATPGLDEPVVTLQSNEDPVPLRELFAFPIFITITNYVLLSFLDIAKASLVSLFLSTAIEFGGLGLSPPMVSIMASHAATS
jgi:hypothetical protein